MSPQNTRLGRPHPLADDPLPPCRRKPRDSKLARRATRVRFEDRTGEDEGLGVLELFLEASKFELLAREFVFRL